MWRLCLHKKAEAMLMALVRRGYSGRGRGEGVPRAPPKSESDAGKAKGDIKYEGAGHWRSVDDVDEGRARGRERSGRWHTGSNERRGRRDEAQSVNKERKERQQVAEAGGRDLVYMAAAEIKTRPGAREGKTDCGDSNKVCACVRASARRPRVSRPWMCHRNTTNNFNSFWTTYSTGF